MRTVNASQSVNGQAKVEVVGGKLRMVVKYMENEESLTVKKVIESGKFPAYMAAGGLWAVRMNGKMDQVFSAVPWNASVVAKSLGVIHKADEEPAPKTSTGQYGAYSQFLIEWEVVEGTYKGVKIAQFMSYDCYIPMTDKIGGKEVTLVALKENKKKPSKGFLMNKQLDDALGIWDDNKPMKWADNILPSLNKRLLKTAADGLLVNLDIFEGKVQTVSKYAPDAWDDEGSSEDDGLDDGEADPLNQPVTEPDPEEVEVTETTEAKTNDAEVDWDAE